MKNRNYLKMAMALVLAFVVVMGSFGTTGIFADEEAGGESPKSCSALIFGENEVEYWETEGPNASMKTLAGEQEYILFDSVGVDAGGNNLLADYASVIEGKIVLISRGGSSFYKKMDAVAELGGIGCIIINTSSEVLRMDVSQSKANIPFVSVVLEDGELIKSLSSANEDGYWTGTVNVGPGHQEGVLVNAKEATCSESGYSGDLICPVCEKVLTAGHEIEKLEHSFEEDADAVEFVWGEGYTSCKIVFTCSECQETEAFDCEITQKVTKQPKIRAAGLMRVTAVYRTEQQEYSTYMILPIPPLRYGESPETGFVFGGIHAAGAFGALGLTACIFGRKHKDDEE